MSVRQTSAVAIGGRGILIEGAPGTGKSSLSLALIDRGAILIGDDGVTLDERNSRIWAVPPPNTAGMLEIRNVGIMTMPTTEAPVALVLKFDPEAPRHIEKAEQIELLGRDIPLLRLRPDAWPLPLRAEWALMQHGLT